MDANNIVIDTVNMQTGTLTVNATGAVSFAGTLTFVLNNGGASFQLIIGSGATSINLSGATLAGTANGFTSGNSIVFLNNQSNAALTGQFANGATVNLGGTPFLIGVNTGTGNKNVTLTAATQNQIYVSNLYLILLNRAADPSGLAAFTAELTQGVSQATVVLQFQRSTEYLTLVVRSLYQKILKRQADPGGLQSNVIFLQNGGTIAQVTATLYGSAEYFQTQGNSTNNGFLTALYRDLLNRNPDPSGLANYMAQLNQGASRTSVATSVLTSLEGSQDLVMCYYQQFLGRNADAGGLQAYSNSLVQGATEESVIRSLTSSGEAFNRPPASIPTISCYGGQFPAPPIM
jgi:hypothetical protein